MIIRTLKWSGAKVEGVADDGIGAQLTLENGTVFNTHNLEQILRRAPRRVWRRIIEEFIQPTIDGPPDFDSMNEADLMRNLYARLEQDLPSEEVPYTYARKFGPFYELLQLKMGRHMACLSDLQLEGRDLDLLYDAARKNTEKLECGVDVMSNPKDGSMIWAFRGDSALVSSKLPFLPKAIRAALPDEDLVGHGLVIAVPSQHHILATGMSRLSDLAALAKITKLAVDASDPTGFPGLWFLHWVDGEMVIEPIGIQPDLRTGTTVLTPYALRVALWDIEGLLG